MEDTDINEIWYSIVNTMIAVRVQTLTEEDKEVVRDMLLSWSDDINFLIAQQQKDKTWKDYQNLVY